MEKLEARVDGMARQMTSFISAVSHLLPDEERAAALRASRTGGSGGAGPSRGISPGSKSPLLRERSTSGGRWRDDGPSRSKTRSMRQSKEDEGNGRSNGVRADGQMKLGPERSCSKNRCSKLLVSQMSAGRRRSLEGASSKDAPPVPTRSSSPSRKPSRAKLSGQLEA